MAAMVSKRNNRVKTRARAVERKDGWLLPFALVLALTGWGRAVWMWSNTPPDGLEPLWLLLWTGIGVAGVALPVHWLAWRWPAAAWVAAGAWVLVPAVYNLAQRYPAPAGDWLYEVAPLLLLLVLGLGLSGAMRSMVRFLPEAQPGSEPYTRPLRQAVWSGLFALVCGWLLINRAFNPGAVVLLAGALLLLETFLIVRAPTLSGKKTRR